MLPTGSGCVDTAIVAKIGVCPVVESGGFDVQAAHFNTGARHGGDGDGREGCSGTAARKAAGGGLVIQKFKTRRLP